MIFGVNNALDAHMLKIGGLRAFFADANVNSWLIIQENCSRCSRFQVQGVVTRHGLRAVAQLKPARQTSKCIWKLVDRELVGVRDCTAASTLHVKSPQDMEKYAVRVFLSGMDLETCIFSGGVEN